MTNLKDNKPLFKEKISMAGCYKLKKYKKGYKIPIISDTMFTVMLNNEKRKKYVAYLISLALNTNYERILNTLTFTKQQLDKDNFYEKGKTVDLICKINDEYTNIEMNNYNDVTSLERNLSYAFELYKNNVKTGEEYDFAKTVQININNFIFENQKDAIEEYKFINEKGKVLTDKIIIINIYLPIIKKKCYNKEKLNELEKLLIIFNENDKKLLDNLKEGNKIMEDYIDEAFDASRDNEVIGLYDKELHLKMLHNTMIKNASNEGYEKGKEEGITQNKIEIAKNMLNKGMEINLICEITGLTEDEIERL